MYGNAQHLSITLQNTWIKLSHYGTDLCSKLDKDFGVAFHIAIQDICTHHPSVKILSASHLEHSWNMCPGSVSESDELVLT